MITKFGAGLALAIVILFGLDAFAQWPGDPAQNLALSTTSGEATITHIAPTSDGGCYVSWWDNTPGHYSFYLQRLNANGQIMWAPNGLLVSNHAQDTWLTDYSITVDSADCAIIALNDIRAGSDWDVYGYRIDSTGAFLWGANGLTISNDTIPDYFPQVVVTAAGNIVFAWQADTAVRMRKVSPDGVDLWTPATKTLTGTYGVSIPRLAPADSDGVILQLLVHQGIHYYDPKFLYAHKYGPSGNDLWGANGSLITNAGGFQLYMFPEIITDNAGGAFSYWFDSRGNVLHTYAQHIVSTGAVFWAANGLVVSITSGQIQVEPAAVYLPATNDLMLFYINKNSDQTIIGIYGQKINSAGARQWTNGGQSFVAMNTQERLLIHACAIDSDAVVTYLERPVGDAAHAYLKAIRVNSAGSPVWETSPADMATTLSGKGYLDACVNKNDQVIAAWQDMRSDPDGDIYLQNINFDGTLGPLTLPGCHYVIGDVNGSGYFNGMDVTFSVFCFSPGPYFHIPPYSCECPSGSGHIWYVAGDVNGSCSFTGQDITRMVLRCKSGVTLIPCPDCPPVP